jgi:hypothetical protein
MEQATKYQFYSFQAIPQPNFDAAMEELAAKFQAALKQNLAKPYPYAPGFFGQKPKTGIRDMKKKTGNLYNSINVSFDPETSKMKVSMLDYWKYVNDGRQPGKYVPLKPLMDYFEDDSVTFIYQDSGFKGFAIAGKNHNEISGYLEV